MQTHKNPAIRAGPAPFKAPPPSITNQSPKPFKPASPPEKPPKFTRDGKKWLIVSTFVIDYFLLKEMPFFYFTGN